MILDFNGLPDAFMEAIGASGLKYTLHKDRFFPHNWTLSITPERGTIKDVKGMAEEYENHMWGVL